MRYLSLFSGIGGFEFAINEVYGDKAICVGYSEVYTHAIKEYVRHYPAHVNLGDITLISKKDIDELGRIDLIVGGFPCSDLSSARYSDREGLDGKKSGLFWTMLKIIKWSKNNNPNIQVVIENNASMAFKWRDMITNELTKALKKQVHCNYFDSSQWVLQRRRRFYWTLKKIPEYTGKRIHKQSQVLLPPSKATALQVTDAVKKTHNREYAHGASGWTVDFVSKSISKVRYKTYWQSVLSLTTQNFVKCITTTRNNNVLLDTRNNAFIVRHFEKNEINKLFGFTKNYVQTNAVSIVQNLYGMTVVPHVIAHILRHIEM
jgi:DNA-cytosine methyltransferase